MNEKIHVLLIEDNAVDARLVKGMLEHDESGIFELKHASTLDEGLRLLRRTLYTKSSCSTWDFPMPTACKPCGESCQ
jgi:hypothetical protein